MRQVLIYQYIYELEVLSIRICSTLFISFYFLSNNRGRGEGVLYFILAAEIAWGLRP
jgi:hypothetical protein